MPRKPSPLNNAILPETPKGNSYGTKLKMPAIRQEAFHQYCKHLAEGNPKESFFFRHEGYSCCHKTIQRYIEENPAEFPPILIEEAKAKRYQHWFNEGKTLMQGGYKCGSPVVWQTIMRNIFRNEIGWDREQIQQDNKTHVERLASNIRSESITETETGDSSEQQKD